MNEEPEPVIANIGRGETRKEVHELFEPPNRLSRCGVPADNVPAFLNPLQNT